ncbi:hypothetical protein NEPAR08_0348 [Nematocida parisii]|nr:hypothetical protein NEPAR08_0348 [Nematocida parisii]KAI5127144.1 hypothetical protein NEPAR03_0811 [Nematocida parisii]
MKFRLVEDKDVIETQEKEEHHSEETDVDSEEFFGLKTKYEESSEEEKDMWEDSDDEGSSTHWTVEKIEKRPGKVRKTNALCKNLLKYTTSHILTIRKGIVKVEVMDGNIYLLDKAGQLYMCSTHENNRISGHLCKIEIKKGSKEKNFKDFIVAPSGMIVALTKAFHSFSTVTPETGVIKEVNLYQYKDKGYSRIKKIQNGFVLISEKSLLIYNYNALLMERIEMSEKIEDVIEAGDYFLVLLESRLVKYCRKMKATILESEVLVNPQVLCIFNESVAVGGKGGVTIFQKGTFSIETELANLENVTALGYMQEMDILVFGDKNKANGIRMYNAKEKKMITTFPPSTGLGYIGGFIECGRALYFGAMERLYILNIPN